MSNVWGESIKISIFGESHGKNIGIIIDGLPAGKSIDMTEITNEMNRRSPGKSVLSTPRKEADEVEIVSGIFNGKTTGAPLCGIIANRNTNSADYNENLPRPGHADLSAFFKYKGNCDFRGGGHFSGRLTAPFTFAGAIAKQILASKNIIIGAHINQIGTIKDKKFEIIDREILKELTKSEFPLLDDSLKEKMTEEILKQKEDKDSIGGIIECAAVGLPGGIGNPFFRSMESSIASIIFSIPAVKGIEFGSGFDFAEMTGSQANDPIAMENDKIVTITNHNGGINGGITNGMPLVFRVVIKPTPSIEKEQKTVNLNTMENTVISIKGRHDPCIVPRAVPVVEAALAICLLDHLCSEGWDI